MYVSSVLHNFDFVFEQKTACEMRISDWGSDVCSSDLRNRLDPAMQALLGHLDILARRDFAELRRICGVDDEDLRDMAQEIRRLDPKPALRFDFEPVQTLVPDIFMRAHPEGGWIIEQIGRAHV